MSEALERYETATAAYLAAEEEALDAPGVQVTRSMCERMQTELLEAAAELRAAAPE
jgi:hypothetical protein